MRKIFSARGSLLLSILVGFLIAFFYNTENFLFWMITFISSFFLAKIMLCFHFMRGQAMFAVDDAKTKRLTLWSIRLFKMRVRNLLLLSVISGLVLTLLYLSYFPSVEDAEFLGERTTDNLKAAALAASSGLLIAFTHWALWWKDYFYGCEYEARVEFKAKGYSPQVTEQKIAQLRSSGAFGPTEGCKTIIMPPG